MSGFECRPLMSLVLTVDRCPVDLWDATTGRPDREHNFVIWHEYCLVSETGRLASGHFKAISFVKSRLSAFTFAFYVKPPFAPQMRPAIPTKIKFF